MLDAVSDRRAVELFIKDMPKFGDQPALFRENGTPLIDPTFVYRQMTVYKNAKQALKQLTAK